MPNVLLVEADPVSIILQKSLLTSIPNVVVTAVPDSTRVVELIDGNQILYDLVILDILMPKINGFQLVDVLYQVCTIPIVAVTGLDKYDFPLKKTNKFAGWYTKPILINTYMEFMKPFICPDNCSKDSICGGKAYC